MQKTLLIVVACGLSLVALSAETKAPKISARYLEYLDKVQDFELEVSMAKANGINAKIELAQLTTECDQTKKLASKGYEHMNQVRACEAAVLAARTKAEQGRVAIETLERNRDIWTVRLAGENGANVDLALLAEKYASKWRSALELAKTQVRNAQIRADRARDYDEWATRMLKKGFMSPRDQQRAVNARLAADTELRAHLARKAEIEESLHETEQNLSALKTE
jgi:hypothetical protein